jgi:hypothetical protein
MLEQIMEGYRLNGGITINTKGEQPTEGYIVSPFKHLETKIDVELSWEEKQTEISAFLERNKEVLETDNVFFGAWYEGIYIYLDVCICCSDLKFAKNIGKAFQQLAIWDVANGCEIRL